MHLRCSSKTWVAVRLLAKQNKQTLIQTIENAVKVAAVKAGIDFDSLKA